MIWLKKNLWKIILLILVLYLGFYAILAILFLTANFGG